MWTESDKLNKIPELRGHHFKKKNYIAPKSPNHLTSFMVGKKSTENASEARSGPNRTAAVPDSTYFYVGHFALLEQIVNGNLKKNQEYNNTIVSLLKETTFCV